MIQAQEQAFVQVTSHGANSSFHSSQFSVSHLVFTVHNLPFAAQYKKISVCLAHHGWQQASQCLALIWITLVHAMNHLLPWENGPSGPGPHFATVHCSNVRCSLVLIEFCQTLKSNWIGSRTKAHWPSKGGGTKIPNVWET